MAATRKPKTPKLRSPELERAQPARPRAGEWQPSRRERRSPGRLRARRKGAEPQKDRISRPLLPGPWQANALAFLLLIVGTVVLYAGDLRLGFFTLDDLPLVVRNPWIRSASLENISHILSAPYFATYAPTHLLSYTLDEALAGPNPYAFHLSSNLWAGVVAGFVFLAALALTGRRPVALAAAALFVVHPLHVEAIAWISSRKDLVAAAFALPSLLAYLRYRRGGRGAAGWYAASLLLFLLAAAGKLSVATLPAVFLTCDLFLEGRPLRRSLADKLPFLLAAGGIALVAASAQPPTGYRPDPYVLSSTFLQSLWLLFGFGSHVIYRVPPDAMAAGPALRVGGALFLVAVFAAPLLLRRRSPLALVLAYWVLLAFIPSQVLSFAHPVADRYLFFPSAAAVTLIAWGGIAAGERLGRRGFAGALLLLALLAFLWGRATLAYLGQWRDPRSVWFASAQKSSDPDVYFNLGWHYRHLADGLGMAPRTSPLPKPVARQLASLVWAGNARLPALLAEWSRGQHGGPQEKSFQDHLRGLAWDAFERCLLVKGRRVMPDLYFNRGWLLWDRGDLQGARKEFLAAVDEASHFMYAETQGEIVVESHNALAIIAWRSGDYREGLRWLRLAEEEQTRAGGHWVPDLTANRQRLEAIVARLPSR